MLLVCATSRGDFNSVETGFEEGNKQFELGNYPAAVTAYEDALRTSRTSAALEFNLGNAYFRQEELGLAIIHYLRARELAPRDPDIEANLRFARRRASGGVEPEPEAFLDARLGELGLVFCIGVWLFCGLSAGMQWRSDWQDRLRKAALGAGLFCLVSGGALASVAWRKADAQAAVIIADEAVVRYGPLNESKSAFTLGDGAEVRVTDAKGGWWRVEDLRERAGWVQSERLAFVREGDLSALKD